MKQYTYKKNLVLREGDEMNASCITRSSFFRRQMKVHRNISQTTSEQAIKASIIVPPLVAGAIFNRSHKVRHGDGFGNGVPLALADGEEVAFHLGGCL